VQAARVKPVLSGDGTKHSAHRSVVDVVRAVADFDASAAELLAKVVVLLNNLIARHLQSPMDCTSLHQEGADAVVHRE